MSSIFSLPYDSPSDLDERVCACMRKYRKVTVPTKKYRCNTCGYEECTFSTWHRPHKVYGFASVGKQSWVCPGCNTWKRVTDPLQGAALREYQRTFQICHGSWTIGSPVKSHPELFGPHGSPEPPSSPDASPLRSRTSSEPTALASPSGSSPAPKVDNKPEDFLPFKHRPRTPPSAATALMSEIDDMYFQAIAIKFRTMDCHDAKAAMIAAETLDTAKSTVNSRLRLRITRDDYKDACFHGQKVLDTPVYPFSKFHYLESHFGFARGQLRSEIIDSQHNDVFGPQEPVPRATKRDRPDTSSPRTPAAKKSRTSRVSLRKAADGPSSTAYKSHVLPKTGSTASPYKLNSLGLIDITCSDDEVIPSSDPIELLEFA